MHKIHNEYACFSEPVEFHRQLAGCKHCLIGFFSFFLENKHDSYGVKMMYNRRGIS